MSIYYVIFWSLSFFSFLEQFTNISKKAKKSIISVYSVLFIIMSTVYAGILGDYKQYEDFFYYVTANDLKYIFNGWFEFLYTLVNLAVKLMIPNYVALRFFLALFVILLWHLIYTTDKISIIGKNSISAMLIVWSLNFGNVFIARSTIVIALCLFSMKYVERKDFQKFLACTMIAIGFHTMSICWLPVYMIYHNVRHRIIYAFSILSFLFIMLFYNKIPAILEMAAFIAPQRIQRSLYTYISYGTSNMLGMNYSMGFIILKGMANIFLLITAFSYLNFRYRKRCCLKNKCFENYFKVYLIGTVIYAVSMPVSVGLSRAAIPFTLTSSFLLPHIFQLPELQKKMWVRLIVFMLFIMYLFFRFYLNIKNGTDEFKTIFSLM